MLFSRLVRMFGLMKGAPREIYCGTCKTMGARYGQRSRMLLNNDADFLAELLTTACPPKLDSPAYRSFNCLRLPNLEHVPMALDFAATAAIVLAYFRVNDHVHDTSSFRWRALRRFLSPTYRKAEAQLRSWRFPIDELTQILGSQEERERKAESLPSVAEPTAVASGMFFAHGAELIGGSDDSATMYDAGYAFGYLIYVLDAYEDRAKDAVSGSFNPLHRFPEIDGRAAVLESLRHARSKLPREFGDRLRMRVEERLGLRPRVLRSRCTSSVGERWRSAVRFARTLREREPGGLVKGAVIVATATAAAFLIPHHARGAESWRHLMGLGLNVMALGAVLASVPGVPPPQATAKPDRGWSSCCCGEWCAEGCCDGCCDSCDCG